MFCYHGIMKEVKCYFIFHLTERAARDELIFANLKSIFLKTKHCLVVNVEKFKVASPL